MRDAANPTFRVLGGAVEPAELGSRSWAKPFHLAWQRRETLQLQARSAVTEGLAVLWVSLQSCGAHQHGKIDLQSVREAQE